MAEKRKVKNPGKLFCRLMAYIFRKYGIACFLVLVFIVLSVLANTQGTMFMKTLIDSYIIPILNSPDKDFAPAGCCHPSCCMLLRCGSFKYLCLF